MMRPPSPLARATTLLLAVALLAPHAADAQLPRQGTPKVAPSADRVQLTTLTVGTVRLTSAAR
ncbi:MAG: hypothetical protein IPJ56_05355 [Gemmatimonadetes bacterium]|nr:hypothetical protein [Gemmatimonadota bacterium]